MDSDKRINFGLNRAGQPECGSYSFPVRPLLYHQLDIPGLTIHFSPGWRPLFIQGTTSSWPHPMEWVRIGLSGSLAYYSALGYGDLASLFQQFYVPVPLDNGKEVKDLLSPKGLSATYEVLRLFQSLPKYLEGSKNSSSVSCPDFNYLGRQVSWWQKFYLQRLLRILKCKVNVLPPDSMMCDYHIFPVILSTGCPYNCGFCKVKDGTGFALRSLREIEGQVNELACTLWDEIPFFKGVFLGNQDALLAPGELIFEVLELVIKSVPLAKNVFLFGSVDGLLLKGMDFFQELNRAGLNFFVNIGIESLDINVLQALKKPLTKEQVERAWEKINFLNSSFDRLEFSINILASSRFPESHWHTLLERLTKENASPRGPIFLSPYNESIGRAFFQRAKHVKQNTKRPVGIYNFVAL